MLQAYGDVLPLVPIIWVVYGSVFTAPENRNQDIQLKDAVAWKTLLIKYDGCAVIETEHSTKTYHFEVDTLKMELLLAEVDHPGGQYSLYYRSHGGGLIIYSSPANSFVVEFVQYDHMNSVLMNRSFHWGNEYPFNR